MKLRQLFRRLPAGRLTLTLLLGCTATLLPGKSHTAEPELAPIFGDHMVLQRNAPVPVWGTASPGTEITVSFADQTHVATAGDDGAWRAVLKAMPASGEPRSLRIAASGEARVIEDVLVGDVWLCSGQSNMAWTLSKCENSAEEVAAAEHPHLRLNGGTGGWSACSPKNAGGFSGVAYYFGRHLHAELEVPVGLISRAVGGTPVEWWTPREALAAVPFAREQLGGPSEAWQAYDKAIAEWKAKTKEAGRAEAGPKPEPPGGPEAGVLAGIYAANRVGSLYATHLEPLAGFAIRGAIWYQGERNSKAGPEAARAYRPLLANLITSWRDAWAQGDFPFLVVQLPTFAGGGEGWPLVQESQAAAVDDVPAAGHVDIRDLPDGGLHPKDKKPVGERLATLALTRFLGDQPGR